MGGFFTATSVGTWYRMLQKPGWNPPGWVFGPVWTVLYVLLWLLLAWLLWSFWVLDRWAGVLWAPYVIWVSFATGLNFAIWRLNATS